MENRIEKLREFVDRLLLDKKDTEDRRCGYVHLYGVAFACAMIAKKRGANIELAVMAGMLHDLYAYNMKEIINIEDIEDHARDGAIYARAILNTLKLTTADETDAICNAIHNHSNKGGKFSELDEILIDADVLQHCLYNPLFPIAKHEEERFGNLLTEFGM